MILFFNSPKQNERLEEAQRELEIRCEKQKEILQDLPNSTQTNEQEEEQQQQEGPLRIL